MNDAAKWGLFDLLKTLDAIHGGQHHEEFQRAAEGLGLVLPIVAPPAPSPAPDQVPGGDAAPEAGGEAGCSMADADTHGRWIDACLELSNPNATLLLADLFASWTAWTEREKAFTGTTNAFSRELVKRWGEGRKGHANTGIFFKGVKLK
jgi:hypothetical protein